MNGIFQKTLELTFVIVFLSHCSTESVKENAPYNSYELVNSALSLCHNNKIAEGKETLLKVMTNEKTNPIYWNALGVCYYLNQENQKANFYFEIGLESIPLYKGADKKQAEAALLNNSSLIHISYARFNDAFSLLKKADTIAPEMFSVKLNLAQIFLEFKYDDQALIILNKLENARPGDFDLLYSMALIYSRKNEFEKALLYLAKIKEEKNKDADVAGLFAYNLFKTNQLNEALLLIEKRKSSDLFNDRNRMLEKVISSKLEEQVIALKKAQEAQKELEKKTVK